MHILQRFVRGLWDEWWRDEILQRSAAVAFYSVFSLPALILIIISAAGFALGNDIVSEEFFSSVERFTSSDTTRLLQQAILHIQEERTDSMWATIAGVFILLLAGSGIIRTMKAAVSHIINEPSAKNYSVSQILVQYVVSLLLVFATAVVLIIGIVSGTMISALGDRISSAVAVPGVLLRVLQSAATYLFLLLLIGLLYQVLPAKKFPVRIIILCSIITGSLIIIATSIAGHYITMAGLGGAYGAAAGVLVLLFWLYLASVLFLLGVELMEVSSKLQPGNRSSLQKS